MKSTGEVMGIDSSFEAALPQVADRGGDAPSGRRHAVRFGQGYRQSPAIVPAVRRLIEHGFTVIATGGTQTWLAEQGFGGRAGQQGRRGPAAISSTGSIDGEVALIFNTTEGWQSLMDSKSIRQGCAGGQGTLLHHRCRIGRCGGGNCHGRTGAA